MPSFADKILSDFSYRALELFRSERGWIYLQETKSGKGRPVPLNDAQSEVFRELRRHH
jgi:hypothetical protein